MNDTEKYVLDAIRTWVWSGFYGPDEIQEMIDDILEDDVDESFLRSAVAPEFKEKAAAEILWPAETDCDRLDMAFDELNASGVIALQNAGYTMSDGLSDVGEVLHERGRTNRKGYCFYHGQDMERAVAGDGLWIAFGDLDDNKTQKGEIGNLVRTTLEAHGFEIEWDGSPETRLHIANLDWKRRSPV